MSDHVVWPEDVVWPPYIHPLGRVSLPTMVILVQYSAASAYAMGGPYALFGYLGAISERWG